MGAQGGWMRMVRRVEWGVWGVNRKTTKETLSSKYSSTKWTVLLSNTKVNYCKYKPTSFSSQLKLMFAQHSPPFNQLEFKEKIIEKISKYQKLIFTNFKCPKYEYDWRKICWGKRSLLVNLLHPPLTEPNLGNFVQLQISSWQLYLPVRCRNTFLSYSSPALALAGGWWGQNRKIVQFREEGTNSEQQSIHRIHRNQSLRELSSQPGKLALEIWDQRFADNWMKQRWAGQSINHYCLGWGEKWCCD